MKPELSACVQVSGVAPEAWRSARGGGEGPGLRHSEGLDPKHPGCRMTGFLGDKWVIFSKVLMVTKDGLEQEFSNLTAL